MQIGNPPRQGKRDQSGEGWDQKKEHCDETIVIAGDAERDLIEHATDRRGDDRAGDHQEDRNDLAKMQLGAPIQEKPHGGDKEESRDGEIRRDRRGFIVFREPFADERSSQSRADRHGNGVKPGAVDRALDQLTYFGPVGRANLAPGDRHRAEKCADETGEENRRRDRNRHFRDNERHHRREKRLEVDDRRDDDRMRIAQCELEQHQSGHPDKKQNSELEIVARIPQQQDEVTATFRACDQQGYRHQQGDLGQEHKLRDAEPLGRQKRKRLLHRYQERSDERVKASKLVIDPAFLRRRELGLGGHEAPALRWKPPAPAFGSPVRHRPASCSEHDPLLQRHDVIKNCVLASSMPLSRGRQRGTHEGGAT
jgi:hypothetical protein